MKRQTIKVTVTLAVILSVWFLGYRATAQNSSKTSGGSASKPAPDAGVAKAIAMLRPTEGGKVHGTVTFTKEADKVKVVAHIEGLAPGKHGFHIHEWGDCSSKDGASAGGHFNPTGMPHAGQGAEKRHHGDLGNIEAKWDGAARAELHDAVIRLEGPNSIIGRGVIVHVNADDLKTQPTGNAGGRQACGVIGVAEP